MARVMVIGNAAGGKSTLSKAVSKHHTLPLYSVDKIQWLPGWVLVEEESLKKQHDAILEKERWLIDGYGPWFSVLDRLRVCDTVILVDHPFRVHLWWALKRQVKSLFWGKPDGPEGCPLVPVTFRLFRMMWSLHHDYRLRLIEIIYRESDRARIIHIKSPKELTAFVDNPA